MLHRKDASENIEKPSEYHCKENGPVSRASEDERTPFAKISVSLKTSLSILLVPFLGLLAFGFVGALTKIEVIAQSYEMQLVGYLIGAVAFIVLSFSPIKKPIFPLVYQIILPVLAICALAFRILAGENVVPGTVFDVVLHIAFAMVATFSFAALAAIGHADEYPAELVAACAYGLYCCASLIGSTAAIMAECMGVEPMTFALFAWVLYFGFQALYPAITLWLTSCQWNEKGAASHDIEQQVILRSRQIGSEYGLTPREIEICGYLGRGHGSIYISQALIISDSTVRTHIKNIYRKLGVSSREELLELMDDS